MDNTKNNNNETQSQYDENKYTIAVMGASGVGKTFFWASYFYSILKKQKETKYKLTPVKGNNDRIDDLMKTIFINHKKVSGTEKVTDISFYININENEVKIDLEDVKGGDTTDLDHFKEELQSRLKHADGLMIFISAEDIMNSHDTIGDINAPFREAINVVRDYKLKKWWEFWQQKADIPVWFIFTKGDKIDPETKEDKLKAKINFLLDSAKENHSSLYNLFNKGKNVKCFKVSAVGKKWDDIENVSVPVDATDDNITDAMDELFDAMYNARYSHNITLNTIWSSVATVLLIILFLADASYQKSIVSNLEKNVNLAVSSPNFNKDIYEQINTKIAQTRNRFVFPELLRNTEKIDSLYVKNLEKYESILYSKIQPNLDVDTNKVPTSEMALLLNEVLNYLSNTDFNQINREHYEKVNNVKWYFEAAKKLKEAKDKIDHSGDSAEIAYNTLSRWILDINEFPITWLDELSVITDNLVHSWSEKIQDFTDPNDYDKHIDNAMSLLSNPKVPAEINQFIKTNCLEKWENKKIALLKGEFNKLKTSLKENSDVEDSINQIDKFANNYPNLPTEINNQLNESRSQCLSILVTNSISKIDVSIDDLRVLVQKYPEITEELKEKIDSKIKQLIKEETSSVLSNINESDSFEALDNSIVLSKEIIAKYPEVKSELDSSIYVKLQSINNNEVENINRKVSEYISNNAYRDAFDINKKEFKELETSISKYRENLGDKVSSLINDNKIIKENKLKEIDDSEYSFCKNTFYGKKSNGNNNDIDYVISILKDYLTRSSNNSRITDINDVVKYLQAIRSGLNGTLTIGCGDYTAGYGINGYGYEAPDVQITVNSRNVKYSTDEKKDDYKPNFNDNIAFLWTSDLGDVTFTAVDIDSSSHDKIITETINVNGFFGYEKLNKTLSGKSCTQKISFSASIPPCPWR